MLYGLRYAAHLVKVSQSTASSSRSTPVNFVLGVYCTLYSFAVFLCSYLYCTVLYCTVLYGTVQSKMEF